METITNESIVILTIRIILGILFFLQGYDKIFKLGLGKEIDSLKHELTHTKIPHFAIVLAAIYTSFTELTAGLMLILGLFTKYALCALGLDLIMVVAVFTLMQPLWDMKFVFPRIVLWSIVMIIPSSYDILSLHHLFFHRL